MATRRHTDKNTLSADRRALRSGCQDVSPPTRGRQDARSPYDPEPRMSRRRGPVETAEYLAAARRFIRAAGRRVGDADPEDLADLLALQDTLAEAIEAAVHAQRDQHGRSWTDIARGAGTTRQAARQRWGVKPAAGAAVVDPAQLTIDTAVAS